MFPVFGQPMALAFGHRRHELALAPTPTVHEIDHPNGVEDGEAHEGVNVGAGGGNQRRVRQKVVEKWGNSTLTVGPSAGGGVDFRSVIWSDPIFDISKMI